MSFLNAYPQSRTYSSNELKQGKISDYKLRRRQKRSKQKYKKMQALQLKAHDIDRCITECIQNAVCTRSAQRNKDFETIKVGICNIPLESLNGSYIILYIGHIIQ
eukprot:496998_1